MGSRKKGDTTPRKAKVRQVCMTELTAQMLDDVAASFYNGLVSHAILDLLEKPLRKKWEKINH